MATAERAFDGRGRDVRFDLTIPTGRSMAGLLAVFTELERAILRARVCAWLDQARREGRQPGRPRSAALKVAQVRELHAQKVSTAEVARRLLSIGRTSVRRLLSRTDSRP